MHSMSRNLALFMILFFALATASMGDPWNKTLDAGLNLTQNSYSNSWQGGDVGSVSWVANVNGVFEKQFNPTFNYQNTSKLQFGQTHTQNKDTKKWQKPSKSTDLIDIDNLGRFTLHAFVDPFVAFRVETQFQDASVDSVKRFFSPMLLTESAGIARQLYSKDKDQILTRLGFALRERITKAIADSAAKTTKTQTSTDGGIESVTDFQLTVSKNISYIGKLTLFKALFYSKANEVKNTPQANYWKVIDVNFENGISAKVSKYITVSLYSQLLYDKQIDKRGRFKETLALGLTYKLL